MTSTHENARPFSDEEIELVTGGRFAVTMPGAPTGARLSPPPIWHGPVPPTGTGPTFPIDTDRVGPLVA